MRSRHVPAGRHMRNKAGKGDFQMLVNLNDAYPYFANLIDDTSTVAMCGYFSRIRPF